MTTEAAAEQTEHVKPVNVKEEPQTWSGFFMYDGQQVIIQLVSPAIVGVNAKGPEYSEIVIGKLRVTRGHKPEQMLFILEIPFQGGARYMTIYPEDVKHVSFDERSAIIQPG